MRNLYPILFAALLIAGCCGPIEDAATYSVDSDSGSAASDQVLEDAKPYLSPIKTEDIGFRIEAANISKNCTSGDKTCQVHEVYRHVVENYNYYADPRRDEFVQSPNTTIQVGGGDCEDLTILLNTYLENIGVETYVVLTDTHAYSLACGVDTDELFYYIEELFDVDE